MEEIDITSAWKEALRITTKDYSQGRLSSSRYLPNNWTGVP
jgi:hypothetical protein